MKQSDIADLSADLVMRYYNNEPLPFLEHMDDDALWYGPAQGQFIRGREEMIRIWKAEDHSLTFTVGDMRVEHISSNPTFCNVMLAYSVVIHYPGGHDISVFQRVLLSWGERKVTGEDGSVRRIPRILVCHISNPHEKHDDDVIYPKNLTQVYAGRGIMPQKGERIHLHGTDHSEYFFLSDNVFWAEASGKGKHSLLHTTEGSVEVLLTIRELAERYPHLFLRCHQSFLVNPHYIRNIRRFEVTLSDGTALPIPAKKYSAFRQQVLALQKR